MNFISARESSGTRGRQLRYRPFLQDLILKFIDGEGKKSIGQDRLFRVLEELRQEIFGLQQELDCRSFIPKPSRTAGDTSFLTESPRSQKEIQLLRRENRDLLIENECFEAQIASLRKQLKSRAKSRSKNRSKGRPPKILKKWRKIQKRI